MTKAAIRYRTNRQYIYRWRKQYDRTLRFLEDRSHRPHSHPNQNRPDIECQGGSASYTRPQVCVSERSQAKRGS